MCVYVCSGADISCQWTNGLYRCQEFNVIRWCCAHGNKPKRRRIERWFVHRIQNSLAQICRKIQTKCVVVVAAAVVLAPKHWPHLYTVRTPDIQLLLRWSHHARIRLKMCHDSIYQRLLLYAKCKLSFGRFFFLFSFGCCLTFVSMCAMSEAWTLFRCMTN